MRQLAVLCGGPLDGKQVFRDKEDETSGLALETSEGSKRYACYEFSTEPLSCECCGKPATVAVAPDGETAKVQRYQFVEMSNGDAVELVTGESSNG